MNLTTSLSALFLHCRGDVNPGFHGGRGGFQVLPPPSPYSQIKNSYKRTGRWDGQAGLGEATWNRAEEGILAALHHVPARAHLLVGGDDLPSPLPGSLVPAWFFSLRSCSGTSRRPAGASWEHCGDRGTNGTDCDASTAP